MCRNDSSPGRRSTTISTSGVSRASTIGSSRRCKSGWTQTIRSTGICGVSTVVRFMPVGLLPALQKSCRRYPEEPEDHALGRSRRGFGSKFHMVTDGSGLPLAVEVSAGQAHESTYFKPVMNAVRLPLMARGAIQLGSRADRSYRVYGVWGMHQSMSLGCGQGLGAGKTVHRGLLELRPVSERLPARSHPIRIRVRPFNPRERTGSKIPH